MQNITPFHVAVPVHNLQECRTFYRDVLGCEEGRSAEQWVDFNFFGHQFVIHYKPKSEEDTHTNPVDGKNVPVPHYGVVLPWDTFQSFSKELIEKGIDFVIEPYIRFKGEPGEQATMFFLDPAGNALEFKAFKDMGQLFAK
ncbi:MULTISPECIES: VOC family protein [Flavobacteriaceae]|uniref:VOC family protein n=1 Tax=Flagellimonas sp. MMG031 TaxID=3158549 RepID=A0AAU7MXA3_9FLAO|nr:MULTISPECIES: VOC family protein [unclassified Allomuricauda]MBO6533778.1 VOC family protein [Allomuricauda sp.]MBO6588478.1 VOC family protein [Allomuricauda sp.]MBO6618382.1 VOC family protein [Allomuricauda sp.]MBO6644016.1 VOC family protein [Allomuricauda sp.]MBO6746900.1 VOC family protein [Allomuricauda sp.]